jgi:hypothetical protein
MSISLPTLEAPDLNQQKVSDDKLLFRSIIVLSLIWFWLLNGMDLVATYHPHDDSLFINLAKNILSGQWLGPYDEKTLIKGPGYPLFLAFVHHLGLPLLFAQQLLYCLFSVLVVVALRPLVDNRWLLLLIFVLVLLNPFIYMYPGTGRVFRFGLSMPLVLATFACMFGLVTRIRGSFKSRFLWATGLGFFFSYLWFTREEGIWLLPSLGLTILLFIIADAGYTRKQFVQRLLLITWIAAIHLGLATMFSTLNEKHYGHPIVTELKTPQFSSALGSLMNIDAGAVKRHRPVTDEANELAFSVSPTFAELEPFFSKHKMSAWPDSFYIWKLRVHARQAGHTDTLSDALAFYGRIGDELQEACKSGAIPCLDRAPTLRPPWRSEYNQYIWPVFLEILGQSVSFSNFNEPKMRVYKRLSTNKEWLLEDYIFVTGEHPVPSSRNVVNSLPDYYSHMKTEKFRILLDIAKTYKWLVPALFSISVVLHLLLFGRELIKRRFSCEVSLLFVILGGLISLVTMLTFVKITLWSVTRPLFSAYPVVLLYISAVTIAGVRTWKKRRS